MADEILGRFARTLIEYSLGIRPGDQFIINSTALAAPLVREVYRQAVAAGAHTRVNVSLDGLEEEFYRGAGDAQLDWLSPIDSLEAEQATARLSIGAPYNTRGLASVDPARQKRRLVALRPLADLTRQRSAAGEFRWCATLFPTQALAQEAGMSLADYEQFVFGAMFLDRDDPPAAWRSFSVEQQQKAARLEKASTLRIVAEDTDLTLSVAGRHWINSDGKRNFPSGEVFTGPVEDSANGSIRFSYPAVRGGREVENVRLTFEKGRVVRAEASRGLDFLEAMMDSDPGARYLGEVAVGNNYGIQRFTKNTLFDEKIGGTCHLALGSSYPETGGKNDSALHWDMVCDLRQGGAVYADGEIVHENGQWKV